jgi:hypothetical protein
MIKKILACLISIAFVFGMGSSVFAYTDPPDARVPGVDITGFSLYTSGEGGDRQMLLKMDMDNLIPGVIQLDLNVDMGSGECNLLATNPDDPCTTFADCPSSPPGKTNTCSFTGGTGGMAGMFPTCDDLEGDPIKSWAGIDIMITVVLREQIQNAATDYGYMTLGTTVQCASRGEACTPDEFGAPHCYDTGETCYYNPADLTNDPPGEYSCFEYVDHCNVTGCFYMGIPCPAPTDASQNRLVGEWFANDVKGAPAQTDAIDRGRIENPVHAEGNTEGDVEFTLPLDRIIQNCIDADKGYNFDTAKAMDTINMGYQVLANMHAGLDDFIIPHPNGLGEDPPLCLPISDVAPDQGLSVPIMEHKYPGCNADMDKNGFVNSLDIGQLIAGWNTMFCPKYCSPCGKPQ